MTFSRPLLALAALSLAAGCAPDVDVEPLFALDARVERALASADEGIPDNLHAAILWRNGCNGCSISTDVELTQEEIYESAMGEEAAQLALQPVEIVGDFPNDFTIAFTELPPTELLDLNFGYPTGVLVLTELGEPQTYARDPRFAQIGFPWPLLFADDAEALGIVAMAPLYVSYVADGSRVIDTNLTEDQPSTPGGAPILDVNVEAELATGYHVARHNGVAINASVRRMTCEQSLDDEVEAAMSACDDVFDGSDASWDAARACDDAILTEHCGSMPDVFSSIEVLESNESVSVTIDGNEDLLRALDGLSLDDMF